MLGSFAYSGGPKGPSHAMMEWRRIGCCIPRDLIPVPKEREGWVPARIRGRGGWRFLPYMAGWNCLRAWARLSAACMALNGRSLGPGGSS